MASRTSKTNLRRRFTSPEELRMWGRRFSRLLRSGDVVALVGPLGAGKTTLVQGIVAGAGARAAATSPTFALANEYKARKFNVYHMDMYRLSSAELSAFPLEDYFSGGVCLIEWADRVAERLPPDALTLRLAAPSPAVRDMSARSISRLWSKRLAALRLKASR